MDDELSGMMRIALSEAISGVSNYVEPGLPPAFYECNGYKGYHRTDCGERSDCCDYLLENGMITHSLSVFYLLYYRNSIPDSEMGKVLELWDFLKAKYPDSLEERIERVNEEENLGWKDKIYRLFEEPDL